MILQVFICQSLRLMQMAPIVSDPYWEIYVKKVFVCFILKDHITGLDHYIKQHLHAVCFSPQRLIHIVTNTNMKVFPLHLYNVVTWTAITCTCIIILAWFPVSLLSGYELTGLSRGGQQVSKCSEVYAKAVKLLVELASLQVQGIVQLGDKQTTQTQIWCT